MVREGLTGSFVVMVSVPFQTPPAACTETPLSGCVSLVWLSVCDGALWAMYLIVRSNDPPGATDVPGAGAFTIVQFVLSDSASELMTRGRSPVLWIRRMPVSCTTSPSVALGIWMRLKI